MNDPSFEDPAVLYRNLVRAIADAREDLIALRHELHRRPCVSGEEQVTTDLISRALGWSVESIADTGFTTRLGAADGPAIGIRTELDAMPIVEATGASFSAMGPAMHACGHDVHQAAFVGFLRALDTLPDVPVPVVGIGQPREETYPSGAQDIVDSGLLQNQDVRVMLGLHVHPGLEPGAISTGAGAVNASSDEFRILVTGRGGHGAYPHESLDPIPVASRISLALYEILRSSMNPVSTATLTVGALNSGHAANVIPDTAEIRGTIRSMNNDDRRRLVEDVKRIAHHIALAARCSADVIITNGEPVLSNDGPLVEAVDPWLTSAGFDVVEPLRSCGADDFAFFAERVPSLMGFLGVDSMTGRPDTPLHSPVFLPPDQTVESMAKAFAAAYAGTVGSWNKFRKE